MADSFEDAVDPRKIFVVYGRNIAARDAMFSFLRALNLEPIEWGKAVQMTAEGAPYIGQILDAGFKVPRSVVVVLTGDEEVRLRPRLRHGNEVGEQGHQFQPRPNVIFEAGMALALWPKRTVLVQIGSTRGFSDTAGRSVVHFSGGEEGRNDLRGRLKTLGCSVEDAGADWLKVGDFRKALELSGDVSSGSRPDGVPKTYTVDAAGGGDYRTITDAIQVAYPGDRIRVLPGVYEEWLDIDKPLDIAGEGNRSEIMLQARGHSVVLLGSTGTRIANLTIRQTDGRTPCIEIVTGSPKVEECDVASANGIAVGIHSGATPIVEGNAIHDSQVGIDISGGARPTIENNEISNNQVAGIVVKLGADPAVRCNRILQNRFAGVVVSDKGRGLFVENQIHSNGELGMMISEEGNPTVRENQLFANGNIGVVINTRSTGVFTGNEIFSHPMTGVQVAEQGNPSLISNTVRDNQGLGIQIIAGGKGSYRENNIKKNSGPAIVIAEGGEPMLLRNNIFENGHAGLILSGGGKGIIEENNIYQNATSCSDCSEIRIEAGSEGFFRKNNVHDGKTNGIRIEGARARLESNEIFANKISGVLIGKGGQISMTGNQVHNNGEWAVRSSEWAIGEIKNNTLTGNSRGSLFIPPRQRKLFQIQGNQMDRSDFVLRNVAWLWLGMGLLMVLAIVAVVLWLS